MTIFPPPLTDPLHGRVCEAVVGLSGVAAAAADRRKHDKPLQLLTAQLPGDQVKVQGAIDLWPAALLEHLCSLILNEAIPQDLLKHIVNNNIDLYSA